LFIENDIHHNAELERILSRFNKMRVYTTYGYMNILPIKYICENATKFGQLQLNTDTHFNAIIMDIDDENLLTEWNAVGLPVPTIQTLNLNNNKAHLVWLLNVPISKWNTKAVQYYRDIVKSIQILIGADQNYQNHQTKNFLNTIDFHTIYNDYAYDLSEFRSFILPKHSLVYENNLYEIEHSKSRHITLFNQLRHYGYKIAKDKNLFELLKSRAELINQQFDQPISPKSIIKSVYEFCHENRNNFKTKSIAKTMGFSKIQGLSSEDFADEVKKRQSKSAKRTSQLKLAQTLQSIKVAIDYLSRNKIKITQSAIANYTKKSISTIKRHVVIIRNIILKKNGLIRSIRVIASRGEERTTSILLRSYSLYQEENCYIRASCKSPN
jgi:hypothetical protein